MVRARARPMGPGPRAGCRGGVSRGLAAWAPRRYIYIFIYMYIYLYAYFCGAKSMQAIPPSSIRLTQKFMPEPMATPCLTHPTWMKK